jgi:hypothetical protein
MIADTLPLTELTQEALRVLYRELGIVNTIRFLNQFTTGFGDYTAERQALTEAQTPAAVLAELHHYQAERNPRPQDIPSG